MPIQQLQNQQAVDTGQRVASDPANEAIGTLLQKTSSNITSGSPVPQMQAGTDSALKALYDFDQSIEGDYQSPVSAQASEMYGPDYFESPAIYGQGAMRNISGQAGNIESLFNTISAFKSLEGSTLNQALGTILGYVQTQEQRRQAEEDRKWEREKFERQMQLENQKLSGGGSLTATEREKQALLSGVARDAQAGLTLKDIMTKYKDTVGFNDIVDAYSQYSRYGAPKEDMSTIRGLYEGGGSPKLGTTAEKDVANYTALLQDLEGIKKDLVGLGATDQFGKSLTQGITGPIATTVGEIFGKPEERAVRTKLDVFRENLRKELYGTAFTAAEQKSAQLPTSGKQEHKNLDILNALISSKQNELASRLLRAGFSQEQVQQYILEQTRPADYSGGQQSEWIPTGRTK
jgi:hypothetical protein